MQRTGSLIVLLLLVATAGGCGSSENVEFDSAMDEYLLVWERLVVLFEGFETSQQMQAAREEFDALKLEMDSIEERLDETAEASINREASKNPRVEEMMLRYRRAVIRLSENPETRSALNELIGPIPSNI